MKEENGAERKESREVIVKESSGGKDSRSD